MKTIRLTSWLRLALWLAVVGLCFGFWLVVAEAVFR